MVGFAKSVKMRHKSKKDMTKEQKQEYLLMMVMHSIEKNMKQLVEQLKSLKPAVNKSAKKYQRLFDQYKVASESLTAYTNQRDQLLLKLHKSELNKEGVKNDISLPN